MIASRAVFRPPLPTGSSVLLVAAFKARMTLVDPTVFANRVVMNELVTWHATP